MPHTTEDSYSGALDWNAVYRNYYLLENIEHRLYGYISDPCQIAFCGFGEIASRLSKNHSVHFIEYSESVVKAAELEFPNINKITHQDILDAVVTERSPVIFVICRVSAYWTSPDSLSRFVHGLQKSPRELVIVDFFYSGKLESNKTLGNPEYSEIEEVMLSDNHNFQGTSPIHLQLAKVQGAYELNNNMFPFSETRAFYNPYEVREFISNRLADYKVSIEPPIVKQDPGFTLVIRRSELKDQ